MDLMIGFRVSQAQSEASMEFWEREMRERWGGWMKKKENNFISFEFLTLLRHNYPKF